MSNIQTFLEKILSARYGKDVRQSIHDAIHQCYEDGKSGSVDLTAREEIGVLETLTTGVKDNIVNALNWLNNILTTLSNNVVSLTQKVNKNETDIGKLNSDLTTKLSIRDGSTINTTVEGKSYNRVDSLVPYVSGDVCVVRSTSNSALLCSPYVESNGNWSAFVYNMSSSNWDSGIHFDILNKA